MLRVTRQYSASAVKKYYEHSDYYEEGPNALKGVWFGKAAKQLGLEGTVNKAQFERIVENRHPTNDNERLTDRTRTDRVIGADFTFNVSKSVSILWALTQDNRILDAVRESVNETLAEIERDIETRVHVGKDMHREKTGNVVGASWLHTTARPEGGVPMPHLHVHAWIANATHDGNKFKAIDFANVKADAPYFEARFHSRVASKLQDRLGVATVRQGDKWFEIKGVTREIIDLFSERTQKIEQVARELGITHPDLKAELGAKTRQVKSKAIPPQDLPGLWRWMLSDATFTRLRDNVDLAAAHHQIETNAGAAVDYAIEHQFTGKATVKERKLNTDAIWRGIGDVRLADIDAENGKREFIRVGQGDSAYVTTQKVLKEEQYMLRFARSGAGRVAPLAAEAVIDRDWLSDEQKAAVRSIWQSKDRVMMLAGKAGTGKTTSALETVEGIQKQGTGVTMLAPTTKAVSVLKKDGFAAHTLAKFLRNEEMQADAMGQLLWVDEAGLISSPDMAKLFHVADAINARVLLAGDVRQHAAVERGKPLELLQNESGVQPVSITQIRRQEDKRLRAVVEKLAKGEVGAALNGLEKLGAFHVLPDETRGATLARRYVDAIEAGESAAVISPSNREKDMVTEQIRSELKARGHVSKDERAIVTLKRYDWDKAQRQDPRLYSKGDIVEFRTKGRGGMKPGDRVEVAEATDRKVLVRHGNAIKELPFSSAGGYAVFRPVKQQFADGDKIKILQNRGAKEGQQRLNNGDVFTMRFTKHGDIDLGNGISFAPEQFPHFSHGVVTTSYSSQGDTKDRVFIAQSSKSFAASSPDQAYVSISRPRLSVEIFTDDLAGLRRSVGRERGESSATELARKAEAQNETSRVKKQITRMRQAANRARLHMERQLKRMAQILPHQQVPAPTLSR